MLNRIWPWSQIHVLTIERDAARRENNTNLAGYMSAMRQLNDANVLNTQLKRQVAKFDHDGDGAVGGSAKVVKLVNGKK
jgi:aminoglycoside phosphotransferase family enzyme